MPNSKEPKEKDLFKAIQKTVMAGVGIVISKETLKKTALGIYEDLQSIIQNLIKELESQGKLKTKETKKLLQELQKKSEAEKAKIYKLLKINSKELFDQIKNTFSSKIPVYDIDTKTPSKRRKSKSKKRIPKTTKLKRRKN